MVICYHQVSVIWVTDLLVRCFNMPDSILLTEISNSNR